MRIVVTGSSSGIGRALVEHLLALEHEVWGLARSDQSEFALGHANRFSAVQCDVSSWLDLQRCAAEISASVDTIDAVIACAGTQGAIGPAIEVDPAKWSATVRTNLDGTFFTFRAFYPLLSRSTRRAKVICFSGGGATKARSHFSAYSVAKTGIVRLVENLADELREQPIDLNAIAPGAILTAMTEEVLALGPTAVGETEYRAALQQKASGGGSIERVLGLIGFLLSPASDGISGRLISAPWDPWESFADQRQTIIPSDLYMLRRTVPLRSNEQ